MIAKESDWLTQKFTDILIFARKGQNWQHELENAKMKIF